MLELDTRGYILDPSVVKGRSQALVLEEFLVFHKRESRLPVICPTKFFDALRSERYSEELIAILKDWIGPGAVERSQARQWLRSSLFARLRRKLLGVLTSPAEFGADAKSSMSEQLAHLSGKFHFGIIAAGSAIWRNLKKLGVASRLKIEQGGEKFLNYLRENRKLYLKKAAKIVVGKVVGSIVGSIVGSLPLLNILADKATERIFIYLDG